MGRVTEELVARIRRQVQEHKLVVWFDPDDAYGAVADELRRDGLRVEAYDGSFFELRHRIDDALLDWQSQELVVYVPLSEGDASDPLAEAVNAGVVMKPGQQPPTRNTRLAVLARAALADLLPAGNLDSIVRQAESGKLTLADLDRIAETGPTGGTGTLGLVFNTGNSAEITLQFLAADRFDQQLVAKAALDELVSLLAQQYEVEIKNKSSPASLRDTLARQVFAKEIESILGERTPPRILEVSYDRQRQAMEKAAELVQTWRNRIDLQASYIDRAATVEREFQPELAERPLEDLRKVQTFRSADEKLQTLVEEALLQNPNDDLVNIAEERQRGFWAAANPEIMERWALVVSIGRLLVASERIETEVRTAKPDATQLIKRYADGRASSEPWCVLDTLHRQMERRVHTSEFLGATGNELVEQLIAKARTQYTAAAAAMAGMFLKGLQLAHFRPDKIRLQVDTYASFVSPALEHGKTAYVLVDALRYEMGRELKLVFGKEQSAELLCALGTLPSITDVGMAALLPGAGDKAELDVIADGRVGLRVNGKIFRNRTERMAYLAEASGVVTCEMRLGDLLPADRATRELVEKSKLVVVTASDELDGLCEKGDVPMARRVMDDVLPLLRRGIRRLFDLGVETAIVTSDHGFLFGESLDSASLIDPPGGQTADLHRRVWVGNGGATSESYLRIKAGEVRLGGDLELALPKSLGGFRSTGGVSYFHGGASLQELLVPALVVRRPQPTIQMLGKVEWKLASGSKTISTRFLSVLIEGESRGLTADLPLVRVEVREGDKSISRPVSSSYGFEEATGFVKLEFEDPGKQHVRPNTVALILEQRPLGKEVDLYLVDVVRGDQTIAQKKGVPVSILNL